MKGRERKKNYIEKVRNKEEMRYAYKVEEKRKQYKRRLRKERKRE